MRGTSFYVQVIDSDNTYICTCNGVLNVEDTRGELLREITATAHAAYMFTRDSDTNRVFQGRVPVEYHTNEDMDALADRVDVTIPWGTIR